MSTLRSTLSRFYIPVALGYIVASAALLGVAHLMRDPASPTFWRNLAWGEGLVLLLWIPYAIYARPVMEASSRGEARRMAVIPTILLVMIAYVVLSSALLLTNIYLLDMGGFHAAAQIVLAAVATLVTLGLYTAVIQAEAGVQSFPAPSVGGALSPAALAAKIQLAEATMAGISLAGGDDLRKAYATLREQLTYGLPHTGRIASDESYRALSQKILENISTHPSTEDEIHDRSGKIRILSAEVTSLASALKS